MNTMDISKRFISWRIRGLFMAEKRLRAMLTADVQEGASDKQLDALYKMISSTLRDITHMQNEIITLQMILDDQEKPVK